MRLRCVALTRIGRKDVEEWVEADTVDEVYHLAHVFASEHVPDDVSVYDENGDLEFASPKKVP